MEYQFKHSLVVMGQLAKDAARTPPSEDDPPFEYVDRSLTILGRTFDANNQKMRQEFLSQREFIASQSRGIEEKIKEVEKKMDGRFEEVDGRFGEMEKKMDGRFEKVDERFQKVDDDIRDIKAHLSNAAAITRNGRIRRMHEPIHLIKVLKPTADPDKFVWASHSQVPKHMKNIYILGQRAKGIFEPSWDRTSNEQSMYLKATPLLLPSVFYFFVRIAKLLCSSVRRSATYYHN